MTSSNKKFFSIFDKFLFGGLGCGMIVVCILLGVFVYVWQNPLGPEPMATATSLRAGDFSAIPPPIFPTATPLFQFSTSTVLPSLTPTQEGAPFGIPSPFPEFHDSLPGGKIVFTC